MIKPWECPRCHKINAAYVIQCFCEPTLNRWIFNFPKENRHFCTICNHDFDSKSIVDHVEVCHLKTKEEI